MAGDAMAAARGPRAIYTQVQFEGRDEDAMRDAVRETERAARRIAARRGLRVICHSEEVEHDARD